MQIKTTLRFHLTTVRIASFKNQQKTTTNVGEDIGRKEPSYTPGGNVSYYSHSGKQYRGFLKN
jgi:hypothetical protein